MTARHDPIDLLATARPPDTTTDISSDETAARILRTVLASDTPRPRQNRTKRRIIGGTLTVFALSAGSVAAWVATRSKPSTEIESVACWSAAELPLPPETVIVGWDGENPIAACQVVWQAGQFESLPATDPPPLTSCISSTKALVVMPGNETTCAELGLDSYEPETDADFDRTRTALDEINNRLSELACLDADAAVNVTRSILDEAGLDTWTVNPPSEPFPDDAPCATAGVIDDALTINIVAGLPIEPDQNPPATG